MKTWIATAVVAIFCLGPPASVGRHPDEVRFQTDARGLSLRAFVTWIGQHLDGPVTFAPPALDIMNQAARRIVVEKAVRLRRDEVFGFGQDLLAPHGLVLADLGRSGRPLWLVESVARPTVLAHRTVFVAPEDVEKHRYERTPITTVLRLRNIRLEKVRAEVEQALGRTGIRGVALIPVPAVNGFIVKDTGRNTYNMMQVIEGLDHGPPPSGPRDAGALEARVKRLEERVEALERARAGRRR